MIDEINEAKFAEHGLAATQVAQILDNSFLVLRNRSGRRAELLVLGRDYGGQCIAVPVGPTHESDVWRPVTAWPCKRSELARLRREGM